MIIRGNFWKKFLTEFPGKLLTEVSGEFQEEFSRILKKKNRNPLKNVEGIQGFFKKNFPKNFGGVNSRKKFLNT